MQGEASDGPWIYLVPVIALAIMILRNARPRKLRVEQLWIMPVFILTMTTLMFAYQPMPSLLGIVLNVAALVGGAVLGWCRGRLTHITVDPETHALTSKASAVGMLLILGIFAVRYGLRSFGAQTAGVLHVSVLEITDALVLLAVGIVCAQRLEMALRAIRLVNDARAS